MHPALRSTAHRPWPLPASPWTWRQSWEHLLFAHWSVPGDVLRPHLPEGIELQEYRGSAWLAVVPFVLSRLALRLLPPVPGLNTFPELNLRTYVEVDGVPGVWFFSLDASNALAVWAANTVFNLPYHRARMHWEEGPEGVRFRSRRVGAGLGCDVTYAPAGPVEYAAEGSLAHWLTERYCVYARSPSGRLTRTEVHHAPWPLQPARAHFRALDLARPLGLSTGRPPDLLHYSRGVDVVLWPGRQVAPAASPSPAVDPPAINARRGPPRTTTPRS